jgi:transposase
LPDAVGKIVFDRFNIMNHMVKAVDKVGQQGHRRLSAAGDGILKGAKYFWPCSEEDLPDKHRPTSETLKADGRKVADLSPLALQNL